MSFKNRYKRQVNKTIKAKANAGLRKTVFRLARQRDILGLVVIFETIAIITLCAFFFAPK